MTMITQLQNCLSQHKTRFDLLSHRAAMTTREAARRAGAQQANPATAINSTARPAKMIGSREVSVSHFCATVSKTRLSTIPAARPAPTLTEVAESTSRTTSHALAPNAMRIPNSLVLVATP